MVGRYSDGRVPEPQVKKVNSTILREQCQVTVSRVLSLVEQLRLNEALANVMGSVNRINSYLEETSPWALARQKGRQAEVHQALYTSAEALRLVSILLWPVLPERIPELWRRLGWSPTEPLRDGLQWGGLQPGTQMVDGPPLFPKDIIKEWSDQPSA
jgi:methionyl-tRNA synthetase